jgi:hypothetical protein
MCPYIVVLFKVRREVPRAVGVVPEIDGHVGECGGGDELTRRAMINWCARDSFSAFDEGVVDSDGSSETGALGATNIDGRKGVLLDSHQYYW